MTNNFRKIIVGLISLIGILDSYLLFDLIYKVLFLDLNFSGLEELLLSSILGLITMSFPFAIAFQVRMIRTKTDDEKMEFNSENHSEFISLKLVWLGSLIFAIASMTISAQIFKVTIKHHFSKHDEALYHNFPVSIIIFFIGFVLFVDAIKRRKLSTSGKKF